MEWKTDGHTNPVRLRWLVNTAIRSRSSRALAVIDLKDPKFDIRVQVQSKADKLAEKLAGEVVELSINNPTLFTKVSSRSSSARYACANTGIPSAMGFMSATAASTSSSWSLPAQWIRLAYLWHRNPSSGGFYIPLLSEGDTSSFYPDFIVWKKDLIYCLDTKGGHLLSDAVARKLFDIKEDGKTKVLVRFITEGKQSELRGKAIKGGYTVWKMRLGNPTPVHVDDLNKAVAECLR